MTALPLELIKTLHETIISKFNLIRVLFLKKTVGF